MPVTASPPVANEVRPAQNLGSVLLRGFAGVGATRAAQLVMSLLVSVALARSLTPDQFGHYALVVAIVGLCALPAYAGFAPLLVRETARYDSASEGGDSGTSKWLLIGALWSWALRLALVVAGLGALAAWFFGRIESSQAISLLLPFAVCAIAVTRIGVALLQGLRRVVVATVPETLVRPAVMLVLLSGLMALGSLDTQSAVLSFCVATLCACLCAGVFLRPIRSKFAHAKQQSSGKVTGEADPEVAISIPDEARGWRTALAPFTGIAAVGYLNTELFVPLVALLADSVEVAYFKIALSLALLVGMPLALVESVIKPQVTRLYEAADGYRLRRLITRSGWGALLLSVPALLVFALYGRELVGLIYGVAYIEATLPMIVLASGFALVNLVGPSMQLLYATRFEKDALVISVLSLVAVVVLSLAMIPTYGALGAASAFAIAKVFRALAFRSWASRRLHALLTQGPAA